MDERTKTIEAETADVPEQPAEEQVPLVKYFFFGSGSHVDGGTLMEGKYNGVLHLKPITHATLQAAQQQICDELEKAYPHRRMVRFTIESLSVVQ